MTSEPSTRTDGVFAGPKQRTDQPKRPTAWLVLSLAGVAVAVTPLVYLAVRTHEAGWVTVSETLADPLVGQLLVRSLALAGVVTLVCVVLGVVAAYLTTRTEFPGRRFASVLFALPLAIPSYVAAYTWISLIPGFSGFWASALVLTLCSYPYVYIPVAASLRNIDSSTEEVSRAAGHGPWRTFLTLTLPHLRPAIVAGSLLVALYVLSDFGAVALLRYTTFTRAIFTALDLGFDRVTAVVLSTVLVAITTVIVVAEGLSRRKLVLAHSSVRQRRARRFSLTRGTYGALGFCAVLLGAALGVPAASMTYWLLAGKDGGVSLTGDTDLTHLLEATGGSLTVSALGAAVTVALALPIAMLAARHSGAIPRTVENLTWISHALPGVVVGLSLVFFGIHVAYPLYQTTALLAFGYAVLFLPLAVGAMRTAIAHASPTYEDIARGLGKRPATVFWTITVPLGSPGISAAALLVFLTCVKELPVTLLLGPTGVDTLATRLWSETGISAYSSAAPYAVALVLLAALPTYFLGRQLGVTELPAPAKGGAK